MSEEMEMRGIPPPSRSGPSIYDVLWPRPDRPCDVTVIAYTFTGYICHWVTDPDSRVGRTRLCTMPAGFCPLCKLHPSKWCGWIQCWNHKLNRFAILTIGVGVTEQLKERWVQHFGFRGQRWTLSVGNRKGQKKVVVEDSPLSPLKTLPDEFSIEDTLQAVMGLSDWPSRIVNPATPEPEV